MTLTYQFYGRKLTIIFFKKREEEIVIEKPPRIFDTDAIVFINPPKIGIDPNKFDIKDNHMENWSTEKLELFKKELENIAVTNKKKREMILGECEFLQRTVQNTIVGRLAITENYYYQNPIICKILQPPGFSQNTKKYKKYFIKLFY